VAGNAKSVQEHNSRFLICARKWLLRKGVRLAAIWVLERGDLDSLHAHTLIHVPEGLLADFVEMMPHWTDVVSIPKRDWSKAVRRRKGVEGCGSDDFWLVQSVYNQGTRLMRYSSSAAFEW